MIYMSRMKNIDHKGPGFKPTQRTWLYAHTGDLALCPIAICSGVLSTSACSSAGQLGRKTGALAPKPNPTQTINTAIRE